jgi:hypothetical protein
MWMAYLTEKSVPNDGASDWESLGSEEELDRRCLRFAQVQVYCDHFLYLESCTVKIKEDLVGFRVFDCVLELKLV